RDLLAHGDLGAGTAGGLPPAALDGIAFTPSESDEIRDLFEARPGSRFNLSAEEVDRFADLRGRFPASGCRKRPACAAAVVTTLRGVLKDRLSAYLQKGISGIAPYARDGGRHADPSTELRDATMAATVLAQEYPDIYAAFLGYPKGDQIGVQSRFL